MTARGQAKLLDFGLATQIAGEPELPLVVTKTEWNYTTQIHLARAGAMVGTAAYMSPEQAGGRELDARTDLFSLGAVLYEMASGTLAFPGTSLGEVLQAVFVRDPESAVRLNSRVPPELDRIITKALQKDPERRYQSAAELRADLERLRRAPPGVVVPRAWKRIAAGLAAAGAVSAASLGTPLWRGRGPVDPATRVADAGTDLRSIAGLPFSNIGGDKDSEYFSDGLSEELLNALARIPELRVISRTSSLQFKGRTGDLQTIGRELNVATLLGGSVRKSASGIRISAQLVNASDGFNLWSETYDRQLDDIFTVQEDISRSVASALEVTVLRAKNVGARGSPEALNLYLKGQYLAAIRTEQALREATTYFQRALELDPGYALPWLGLAEVVAIQAERGYVPWDQGFPQARRNAERALQLDPDLAQPYRVLAHVKTFYDWDWAGADAAHRRALSLGRGNASRSPTTLLARRSRQTPRSPS